MKNVQAYLIDNYNKLAYTHSYIFGYTIKGVVYASRVMQGDKILPFITTIGKSSKSRGNGSCQLRYNQNKERKAIIMSNAVETKAICTVEFLEQMFKSDDNKKNRGELFEAFCADAFGYRQIEISNTKFTDAGDLVDDVTGVHYQVKYHRASFTDEKTIHNLLKKAQGE